jgi:gamma-glutamyltranspeptidase / glutathione hydrolase
VKDFDGVLDLDDLLSHRTAHEAPISATYRGMRVHETHMPTQGLATLIALKTLEKINMDEGKDMSHHFLSGTDNKPVLPSFCEDLSSRCNVDEVHKAIECMRMGFADALAYIGDPLCDSQSSSRVDVLLSEEAVSQRSKLFKRNHTVEVTECELATAFQQGETVYFCCVDKEGNACSMINSNYMGFGSGIMPKNTGEIYTEIYAEI